MVKKVPRVPMLIATREDYEDPSEVPMTVFLLQCERCGDLKQKVIAGIWFTERRQMARIVAVSGFRS